jgi:CRISPR/Cas system-associated protein Cas10 (large subunit of type III CRISPR-Cas system)
LPEILSLITLSASLVLAFAFKKGLVPLLSNTLAKIGDSVTHIKEKGDENGKIIDTFGEKVSCRIEMLESLISDLSEKLKELAVSLDEAERRAGDREKLTTLINGQIDMLYDVFMSSSLPHYQKEAVGARIAEMREAIKDDEGK